MIFELLHSPYPDGYGEALLPIGECKTHLRVLSDDEDELIVVLRDAAIDFVERYCSVRLLQGSGLIWRAEGFPSAPARALMLGVRPVMSIEAVTWRDGLGDAVTGSADDLRLIPSGDVLPAIGGRWPAGVGGGVEITFTAGYASGAAPRSLLQAAKMFLGHLWLHREAVIDSGATSEVPLGVATLCAPFRRVLI